MTQVVAHLPFVRKDPSSNLKMADIFSPLNLYRGNEEKSVEQPQLKLFLGLWPMAADKKLKCLIVTWYIMFWHCNHLKRPHSTTRSISFLRDLKIKWRQTNLEFVGPVLQNPLVHSTWSSWRIRRRTVIENLLYQYIKAVTELVFEHLFTKPTNFV